MGRPWLDADEAAGADGAVERGDGRCDGIGAGPAVISGATLHPMEGEGGIVSGKDFMAAVSTPGDRYGPRTRLLWVEQTTNLEGGRVWPISAVRVNGMEALEHVAVDDRRLFDLSGIIRAREAHDLEIEFCAGDGLAGPGDVAPEEDRLVDAGAEVRDAGDDAGEGEARFELAIPGRQ